MQNPSPAAHPLDPLSADEIRAVTALLAREHGVTDGRAPKVARSNAQRGLNNDLLGFLRVHLLEVIRGHEGLFTFATHDLFYNAAGIVHNGAALRDLLIFKPILQGINHEAIHLLQISGANNGMLQA